jgi:hypothetical protein
MDLTILSTVKDELGILQTDTSQDDRLTDLIKAASGIVAEYCGTVFGAEDVEETFWVDSPSEYVRSVMLSRTPVIEITSVEADGTILDPTAYRVDSGGCLHRIDAIGSTFWVLTNTLVVSYTAGYVLLDSLPYGVERAAISLIKNLHASTGRDPLIRSEDIPGLRSVTYQAGSSLSGAGELPSEVVALLRPHRRLAFA